jgi:Arabinose-binding domain of AraC transcription regulator, N-term
MRINAIVPSSIVTERLAAQPAGVLEEIAKGFPAGPEALGDSAFGLHLAQQANLREAGLLFYVTSAARTIGETLPLYEHYCRIVNEAVRVKLLPIQNGVANLLDYQ